MKHSSVVSANHGESFLLFGWVSPPRLFTCLYMAPVPFCHHVLPACVFFFPLPSHFIYNVPLSSHLPPTRSPLSGRRREIAVWRLLLNISSELNIYAVFCDQLLISKWGVSGQLSCIPPYEGGGGGVKTNEEPVF